MAVSPIQAGAKTTCGGDFSIGGIAILLSIRGLKREEKRTFPGRPMEINASRYQFLERPVNNSSIPAGIPKGFLSG